MKLNLYLISLTAVLLCITSCEEEKAKTIYLIPDGFEGEVVIVYAVSNSNSAKLENGARVVEIGTSGKVKSKHKTSVGVADDSYYMVSSNGARKKILFDHETNDPEAFCISGNITSSITIDDEQHHVEAFLVIKKKDVESYRGHQFDLK